MHSSALRGEAAPAWERKRCNRMEDIVSLRNRGGIGRIADRGGRRLPFRLGGTQGVQDLFFQTFKVADLFFQFVEGLFLFLFQLSEAHAEIFFSGAVLALLEEIRV